MTKNSVVAGDYKGRGIVCGAKGPFINLKGSKTIFLNKQNIKRYEPVTKESTKDESSSLSLEILGAELLSSICALSESSQKADEFLVAVEFVDESKCVINIDSRTYRCFVNAMLEEIPSKSGSAPQKKSHTLTIALIIAGVAIVLGLSSMIAAGNSLSSTDSDVKQVFDAKRFLVEEDGVARPKTMEEVVADLGEPQKSEDWNYQFGASEYPVKSLSYHDGNYVYDFYEGTLARIQIFIPATFSSKDTIPQMYNLDSGHVVADTPAAYRIENCGVHDLWCTYGDEENTIDIAYISYTNFFDDPNNPVMVEAGVSNTSENTWLEFDEKTWPEFVNLYTAHNNLMNAMNDFSNGNISSADFYQYCEDSKEYFANMSLAFDFGESDEEKAYLSAFESMALSDQMAAESLMKYLDSRKTSDLSNAQENIQNAVTAATTIASNRGALLAKAGLSQEEIQVKIEEDMSDLG